MSNAYFHNHTVYSLFDGAQTPKELVQRAKDIGATSLAISEHGTMISIPKFVAECRANNIKPIVGVEIYLQNKNDEIINKGHSCLYALNDNGYRELCKIMTDSEINQVKIGKSVFPITTMEILHKYVKKGDIAYTTACVGGYIPQLYSHNYMINKQRNIINKELADKNLCTPNDAEYILLLDELKKNENLLNVYAEKKNHYEILSKQKYKQKLKSANKLSGEDKQIILNEVDRIIKEVEEASKNLVEIKHSISLCKNNIKQLKSSIEKMEKTHKEYYELEKKLKKLNIIDDKIINSMIDEKINELIDIFGIDNTYIEIQYHGLEVEAYTFKEMIKLAKKRNIKLIAANDSHMAVNTENNILKRQLLSSMRFGNWQYNGEDAGEYYLKTYDELKSRFKEVYSDEDIDEAINNTEELARKSNIKYDFGHHPPKFPLTPSNKTSKEYLEELTLKGAEERYSKNITKDKLDRIMYELSVINQMNFTDYFLCVQDYIKKAKTYGGYPVGPGRGSAAGSAVCYCLHITEIDPFLYDLMFERFLNPNRASMPDIDVDFARGVRPKLIEYCKSIYGEKAVCQISTIGQQMAKAATRNVAKILADKYCKENGITDKNAKTVLARKYSSISAEINASIPKNVEEGRECTLKECKDELLKKFCNSSVATQIIELASLIEETPNLYGVHAAGVIISDTSMITDYLPLRLGKLDKTNNNDDEFTDDYVLAAQCDKYETEDKFGLLKMDFLGLRSLNIIAECKDKIKSMYGIDIDINNIPIEQEVIDEIFAKGNTTGVFQYESPGAKKILMDFKPSSFEDVILSNAVNRPGPIEYVDFIIKVKQGIIKPHYMIPEMAKILDVTYGKPIYQEQLMKIFNVCAGFSAAEADNVRRYMSKKKVSKFIEYKEPFIVGCCNKGANRQEAEEFWESIVSFAKYAFNKSHAACYSWISYITAYFKYHYPAIFICANINWDDGNKDDFYDLILEDCRRLGIKILCPDINVADKMYKVIDENTIMAGFCNIKGLKSEADDIIKSRENNQGYFRSFKDYIIKGANGKFVEKLIKCGAFDRFNDNRQALLNSYSGLVDLYKKILDYKTSYENLKAKCNSLLFDFENTYGEYNYSKCLEKYKNNKDIKKQIISIKKNMDDKYAAKELFTNAYNNFSMYETPDIEELPTYSDEKNLLGMYITGNPIDKLPKAKDEGCININNLYKYQKRNVNILGIINNIKEIVTKKNDEMAFIDIQDKSGQISITIFPKLWTTVKNNIKKGEALIFNGKVDTDNKDNLCLILNSIDIINQNGEYHIIHVNGWDDWENNYYPIVCKNVSNTGEILYVHDRITKKIKKFEKKVDYWKIINTKNA